MRDLRKEFPFVPYRGKNVDVQVDAKVPGRCSGEMSSEALKMTVRPGNEGERKTYCLQNFSLKVVQSLGKLWEIEDGCFGWATTRTASRVSGISILMKMAFPMYVKFIK